IIYMKYVSVHIRKRLNTKSKRDWSTDVCSSDLVWEDKNLNNIRYHMLFTFLFNEPFVPTVIQDEARASDALAMRRRFADETGIKIGRASCRGWVCSR